MTKLLRKRVTGGHNKTVDTAKGWVATHDQGRAETLIREMIADRDAPIEAYGGQRDAIRLTSVADAVAFIEDNGGDLPFGFG